VCGELWAIAITLRMVLVENLRRLGERVVASRAARREADNLADRLLGAGGRQIEPADTALAAYERTELPEAFFVQLVQRLRDQDPRIAPALTWLDERLTEQRTTADAVVREEHQRQVSGSVTVRNIITSMRLISDIDWTELVERVCLVDDLLGADSRFGEMDFPTRNLYRSAIEELARGSRRSEIDVAQAALRAAKTAGPVDPNGVEARFADPGYYLIAGGRQAFEDALGYRPPLSAVPGRVYRRLGIGGYVSGGGLVAAACLAIPLVLLSREQATWRWLVILGVLGVAPAVDLGVALVNYVVTRGFRATLLPALSLKDGVPPNMRTLVAVPTMLVSPDAIADQIERLEIHYLASPGGDLQFALLTDWTDSPTATRDGDDGLLHLAREGKALTGGQGVDTAIEAVGVPATFGLCQDLVAPGGIIANIGVHGVKVDLHLETLWSQNIAITTRLVDTVTTPMLLKTVQSKKIDPLRLITHRFPLDRILDAYDTFGRAAETRALKVIIEAS
jgi:cyclic beta-1,2-glucan synthetase